MSTVNLMCVYCCFIEAELNLKSFDSRTIFHNLKLTF